MHILRRKLKTVYGAGINTSGEVGDATIDQRSSPVSVVGNHSFNQIASHHSGFLGLKEDGTIWRCGKNGVGDNTTENRSSPVSVVGNHSFISISAASHTFAALKSDGSCWTWSSYNTSGIVGDNTSNNRSSPVSVVGNHSFMQISVGYQTMIGLKSDGSAWAWGSYSGDNTTNFRSSPVSVVGNHSFIQVTSGLDASFGLKSDGTAWGWGVNSGGVLGDNTTSTRASPVSVIGNHSFIKISTGYNLAASVVFSAPYTYALKSDGTLWSWGYNSRSHAPGILGDGTHLRRSSPVSVLGNHSFVKIDTSQCGILLKSNGEVWGIGSRIDIGTNTGPYIFTPTIGISVGTNIEFTRVASSTFSSATIGILDDNGVLWCWGNFCPTNGTTPGSFSSPVSVVGNHSFIAAGFSYFTGTALKSDGTAWGWGISGDSGDNTMQGRSSPVSVVGNHSFIKIHAQTGLKVDGSVWTWGPNGNGFCGDNTTTNRSSPVSVVGNHSFIDIIFHHNRRFAIKDDYSLWTWGIGKGAGNDFTALGDGTKENRSSPVSVVGNHSFIQVTNLSSGPIALDHEGLAWTWGDNSNNYLLPNPIAYSTPVSVVGNHAFTKINLKDDGSVWLWGANVYGRIGDNTTENRSSPVSVVGNHSFIDVVSSDNTSAGLKSDGTIWSWGNNDYGQLGDNTITSRSSPVSVVGNHSFISITMTPDAFSSTFGLKSDGTLWSWGNNSSSQLGDNSKINRSSPVSVVGNHSFIAVGSGAVALKSDGSVWGWSVNSSGQIGDGTGTNRSSPVSVVGNHSFINIVRGELTSTYLKADGSAWCCGQQYGDGTSVLRSSPVSVIGNHSFIKIHQYSVALALKLGGEVWGWGPANSGNLGTNTGNITSPVLVVGYGYEDIKVGGGGPGFVIGLTTPNPFGQRSIFTWGSISNGKLGNNEDVVILSPTRIPGSHSFIKVVTGGLTSYALKADGSVWGWGSNDRGQVGTGSSTTVPISSPVSVIGNHSFIDINATIYAFFGLKANGEIWTFGQREYTNTNTGFTVGSPTRVIVPNVIDNINNETIELLNVRNANAKIASCGPF